MFSGRHLLVSYRRTSNHSDSRHSWAILTLLMRFIRKYWPDTRIVFRGDGGLYRPRLLSWCDRNNVDYQVGINRNSRLLKDVDVSLMLVRKAYENRVKKSLPPTGFKTSPKLVLRFEAPDDSDLQRIQNLFEANVKTAMAAIG